MAFCALRNFEDATSFIAEVIFNVPFIELILRFISLSDAISVFVFTWSP